MFLKIYRTFNVIKKLRNFEPNWNDIFRKTDFQAKSAPAHIVPKRDSFRKINKATFVYLL